MVVAVKDPRLRAPVGAYLTDGVRLLWVLESETFGVLCEDAVTELLVELSVAEVLGRWKRVRPSKNSPAGET